MIETTQARPFDLPEVSRLYAQCGYGGGVDEADITLVAKRANRVVGAVRLCNEEGVTVLRGMQIFPAFQRRGIGRTLLAACVPYLNRRDAFCLPYAHLLAFYASVGFRDVAANDAPPFLAIRLQSYLASDQDVIVMGRQLDAAAIDPALT